MMDGGPVPELKIPATPEIKLAGVTRQFLPNLLKCNLGGYITVLEGRGINAATDLFEATDFITQAAFREFGETYVSPYDTMPKVARFDEERAKRRPSITPGGIASSILAAIVFALGVKVIGT